MAFPRELLSKNDILCHFYLQNLWNILLSQNATALAAKLDAKVIVLSERHNKWRSREDSNLLPTV